MEHIQSEEHFINLLLADKENIRSWDHSGLQISQFDEQHQNILSGIRFAANNDVLLTRETYKNFLADYKKMSPAETAAQVALYNRCLMKVAKKDDLPMLVGKVKTSYIRRKTSQFLREYNNDREKLGDLGANRSMIEKMQTLEADASEGKTIFVEAHKYKEQFMIDLDHRRRNPNARLTCGIAEIDETMDKGFKEGHLTLFCAPIGGFKTTMMVNVAANLFARSGANVMYIPLEMPHDEILTKLVSRETGIDMHKIEHAEKLTEEEIRDIAAGMDKWQNMASRFSILDMAERTRVSVIKREIEKRISYFKPRVVFVDYADNLIPDYDRGRSDLNMNDMLEDLRKMGKALGFSVVSAAQLAKDFLKQFKEEKEGKQSSADSTSIRGGLVYTANSDTVYAQLRDPMMPNERLVFMCIKSRHGKPTFGVQNNIKTHLMVRPEIALIESPKDIVWAGPKDNGLLQMASVMPTPEEIDAMEGSPF